MEDENVLIKKESLIHFLGTERFLMVDIRFVTLFQANGALFLTNLIDKYLFMKKCNKLKDDGFFYTFEQQNLITGLSISELRTCKKRLITQSVIYIKKIGMPSKEYYYINFDILFELLNIGLMNATPRANAPHRSRPNADAMDIIHTNIPYNNISPKSLFLNEKQTTKINKEPISNDKIIPILFDKFWKFYPKKASKGDALTAWEKLCMKPIKERPTWIEIRKAINFQSDSPQWKDGVIPNASTWLNQKRWMNDPKEMIYTRKMLAPKDSKVGTYKEISGRKFWYDEVRKDYYQHGSDEKYVE